MLIPKTSIEKVLVVDDVEENRLVMEAMLARPDIELLFAASGTEALELLLTNHVALALLDVQMPGMDGFELAELMRGTERTRTIPIIFVTAGVADSDRLFRGYELGAVDYLVKPVEPRILRQKVNVFLELQRQRAALAESLRINETFVAILAHDLRSPLGAVTMGSSMLVGHPEPMVANVAKRIDGSARRMARLVDGLCDLSAMRLGEGLKLSRERVALKDLLTRIVAEQRLATPSARIDVEAGDIHGQWDEARMEQVLSNLIGNAVKHGDPSEPVRVWTSQPAPHTAVISLRNAGAVPPAILPHLFDAFRSGGGSATRPGLGLGLFIAREISRAHGGDITVSTTEKATTFRVELPVSG